MKRKSLTLAILGLLLTSCSFIEKFKTPEETTASTAPVAETDSSSLFASDEAEVQKNEENNVADDFLALATPPAETHEVIPEIKEAPVVAEHSEAKKIKFYKVKKGETLMQIAFKIYGDMARWQDLKNLNQEKVSRNATLATGMSLKYQAPETEFVWNPIGVPYLINRGETLGIISNNVYQTPKKWKSIWENNKPLIKNPNVIFAGFTVYYIKEAGLAEFVQPKKEMKAEVDSFVEKVEVANELLKAQAAPTAESEVRETASDTQL